MSLLTGGIVNKTIIKFKHDIKTPLSTISIAVECLKPFIEKLQHIHFYLDLDKMKMDENASSAQIETMLKLLNNIELAVEQINRSTELLEEL